MGWNPVKGRLLRLLGGWRSGEGLGERDFAVLGDYVRDFGSDLPERSAVLILPQQREHFAAKAADFAVRQNRLESVADFGPVLVIADSHEDHDAAVFAFGTDAPFLEETIGEVGGGAAFERMDGHDGDLRVGLLIEFLAKSGQLGAGIGVDYARKIVDVALRRELFDLFAAGDGGEQHHKCENREQLRELPLGKTCCFSELRFSATTPHYSPKECAIP